MCSPLLFWFAGWGSPKQVWLGALIYCYGCGGVIYAAVVFAAFEWLSVFPGGKFGPILLWNAFTDYSYARVLWCITAGLCSHTSLFEVFAEPRVGP